MIVFDQDQGPSGSTTSLWQHPEATVWRRIKTGRCIARLCWQLGTYTCNNSRTNLWFWVNSFLLSLFFLIEPMITCMVDNALQWSVLQPVSYEESQSGWGLRGPQVHLVPPLLKQGCSELVPWVMSKRLLNISREDPECWLMHPVSCVLKSRKELMCTCPFPAMRDSPALPLQWCFTTWRVLLYALFPVQKSFQTFVLIAFLWNFWFSPSLLTWGDRNCVCC